MEEILPSYILKRSVRSRTVRVSVKAGGVVTVSAPYYTSERVIQAFLSKHADWLCEKVAYFKKFPERRLSLVQEKKLFIAHKTRARMIAESKVAKWNGQFGFSFNKVSIRNSRSRWGSCSSKGTLCFNYKIAFLPEHLADYLAVHELCHLKEPNHGKDFWGLVGGAIPNYAVCRRELRNFDLNTSANTNIL